MRITPQKTIPSSLDQAKAAGCDTVQYKFNGQWVRIEVLDQYVHVYNCQGAKIVDLPDGFNNIPTSVSGTFIGNLLFGNERIVLWDVWVWGGERNGCPMKFLTLDHLPYRQRFALLGSARDRFVSDTPYRCITNYPIGVAEDLWKSQDKHHVGLIFRRSQDVVDTTLYMIRKYHEVPTALT